MIFDLYDTLVHQYMDFTNPDFGGRADDPESENLRAEMEAEWDRVVARYFNGSHELARIAWHEIREQEALNSRLMRQRPRPARSGRVGRATADRSH